MGLGSAVGRYLSKRAKRKRKRRLMRLLEEHDLEDWERRRLRQHVRYAVEHGGGPLTWIGLAFLTALGVGVLYFGLVIASGAPTWFTGFFALFGIFLLGIVFVSFRRFRRAREITRLLSNDPRLLLDAERTASPRHGEHGNRRR